MSIFETIHGVVVWARYFVYYGYLAWGFGFRLKRRIGDVFTQESSVSCSSCVRTHVSQTRWWGSLVMDASGVVFAPQRGLSESIGKPDPQRLGVLDVTAERNRSKKKRD